MGPPWLGEYALLARQALLSTFRFSGRARRTEFGAYYLAAVIFAVLLNFALMLGLEFEDRLLVSKIVGWLIMVPLLALFVRRMHDQDRSGWWAIIPAMLAAYNLIAQAIANRQGISARIGFEQATWPWDWVALPATLAFVVLFLLSGTAGPNRFGPDPRDRED